MRHRRNDVSPSLSPESKNILWYCYRARARRLRDILTAFSTSTMGTSDPSSVEKMTTRHKLSVSVSQLRVRRDQKKSGVTDGPAGGPPMSGGTKDQQVGKQRKKRKEDRRSEIEKERKKQEVKIYICKRLQHWITLVSKSYLIFYLV